MYLNDRLGDCTAAGIGHKIEGDTRYGQGATVEVTDDDVLRLYEATGGYDPSDPSTDQGAVCQDVLKYVQKTGVAGHKIIAYAQVDLSNLTEVRQAIALFGQIYCGFNFPDSAMTQFNAGQPWDVVKGARIEGGHCVTIGAYDPTGFECITWGAVQKLTLAFFKKYFDEAWVIVDSDFVNAQTGKDAAGVDLYTLGQDFAALTGKANPIPQPRPTPTPAPTPAPIPAATGAQVAAAVRAALTANGV
jgi:hypothetical protein